MIAIYHIISARAYLSQNNGARNVNHINMAFGDHCQSILYGFDLYEFRGYLIRTTMDILRQLGDIEQEKTIRV